ncbi:hypothetical protein Leryth_017476 [Lithospermum erythrorhizon]|uniref:SBP-type domain-containing protein n=1 Tax=Lithospermum erythrorhizon TaxID=34254 RepID=A0AAV3P046_LITER|nr:hypothetical protein Leryth_017476 [Lithospermum erythrorhizon]
MLGYEWGNPSNIMLSSDENIQESDQNRQMFDPYGNEQSFSSASASLVHNNNLLAQFPSSHHHEPPENHHHHLFHNPHAQESSNNTTHFPPLYDPRSYGGHNSHLSHQASLLSLEPAGLTGYMMMPKTEPVVSGVDFSMGGTSNNRIGLNLGVRTYFSSDDDFVNRLYRRSRGLESGSINSPKCQAEGCNADLTHSKHYHRRHKVCEFHSKASTVIAAGLTQRFCQQCSRFHLLSEFDNGKRSCRKRLADHNKRRRKSSHQQTNQENANKSQLNSSSSDSIIPRSSPSDSGVQTSSVTVAVSPPRIFSLDY